jgi:hypothetical protein
VVRAEGAAAESHFSATTNVRFARHDDGDVRASDACFGGFDINACLATCAGPQDPCFQACFDKLDNAGPPTGCESGLPEPDGVDCANGINIKI